MKHLRGINNRLIEAFKSSPLYPLTKESSSHFFTCIRDNAIGIYYYADRIAMVKLRDGGNLSCEISSYYLSDCYLTGNHEKSSTVRRSPEQIVAQIEVIKKNSDKRSTPEKKAQQTLVSINNANPNSKWFCFDIEYRQSTTVQKEGAFTGRFDILAVSKNAPHRIAIIELKYNSSAIGGKSGVVKHLNDFITFNKSASCQQNLKTEIGTILGNLRSLGFDVPKSSDSGNLKFASGIPEYYVICLYDTKGSPRGTVGGYLFKEPRKHWGTQRKSKNNAMAVLGPEYDIESSECPIKVKFLFKRVDSPGFTGITDLLDHTQYEDA